VRRWLTAGVCLILPRRLKPFFLRLLGHPVHNTARIGCSLVLVSKLALGPAVRIGHGNFIRARRLVLRKSAIVGKLNYISGVLSIRLGPRSLLGNRNVINRLSVPGQKPAQVFTGELVGITAGHYLNANESIIIGDFSTIAGIGSQLWTHGFIHFSEGDGRAEVVGRILIGRNCYIGSGCTINPGITIADVVSVSPNVSIGTDLLEAGNYVPGRLRHIPSTPEERIAKLERDDSFGAHYRRRKFEIGQCNRHGQN
jgi:acetyltransferase-like isoleucine patch superfamily enzyme